MRAVFEISDSRKRWVISRTPPMSPALAIAEIAWILRGDNRLSFLTPWNRSHAKFVGEFPLVHGAYGSRLRNTFGVDQIVSAAAALRATPASRQVVLQIYYPEFDLPGTEGTPRSPDIPCNVSSLLKIRNGRLEWTQILRSNDLFLGVPYNFVQFTTLQEVIAGLIGVDVGTYAHFSDSLHVYQKDARMGALSTVPPDLEAKDDLRIPAEFFELVTSTFHGSIETVGRCTCGAAIAAAIDVELPQSWKNLLLVCASERARRIGDMDASNVHLSACTNSAVRSLQLAYATARNH